MAWIESHQSLGQHPKTLALSAELMCPRALVVGYLQYLWWWCMDYAPDGKLRYPAAVIAGACDFQGRDPDQFLHALVVSGFVDRSSEGLSIHDWPDYSGALIARREANAERKRRERNGVSGGRTPDVRVTDEYPNGTSGARHGATNPTNLNNQPDIPDQPDQPVRVGSSRRSLPARPRAAQAPDGDRRAESEQPPPLRPAQQRCPLCPEVFPDNDSLRTHMAESPRHKVRPVPEDFKGTRRRRRHADLDEPIPPEVKAELESMAARQPLKPDELPASIREEHERLLALERSRQG